MKKLVELLLDDTSDKETFRFQVGCDNCRKAYLSKLRRFSKAGEDPPTDEKPVLYVAIYEQEHRVARQDAVAQLAERFDYSPIRKQVVCDDCFLICVDMDIWRGCAERLQEMGVSVLANVSNRG